MALNRPLGVKLIAGFFLAKSILLLLALCILHFKPTLRSSANEFILYFSINLGIALRQLSAFLTAILDISLGIGIWLLKGWSRTVIVIYDSYGLCSMAFGSAILMGIDRKFLISQTSSHYFAISVVGSALMLFYLLQPDVKKVFGKQE